MPHETDVETPETRIARLEGIVGTLMSKLDTLIDVLGDQHQYQTPEPVVNRAQREAQLDLDDLQAGRGIPGFGKQENEQLAMQVLDYKERQRRLLQMGYMSSDSSEGVESEEYDPALYECIKLRDGTERRCPRPQASASARCIREEGGTWPTYPTSAGHCAFCGSLSCRGNCIQGGG